MTLEPETSRGMRLAFALALLLGTLALYSGVGGHDFVVYDDNTYVYENEVVQSGLSASGLTWAFTSAHAANWHPITWLSHMLDVELWGLAPGGHHWTSAALHAVNALLVFVLLAGTTRRAWPAFLAAAVFAWHPLRVESVAWIAERKDVLSGLFALLTLLAYTRWVRQPSAGRYTWILLAFALGLMAKPMLVTLPLVLFLFDRWPLGREGLEWRSKLPLLALAGLSAVATVTAQSAGGAVVELQGLGPLLRLQNAVASTGIYLLQTVWPSRLACFYPHAAIVTDDPRSALLLPALAAGTSLALLTVLALQTRATRPFVAVGLAWYVLTLLPVIGLVQVGMQAHADRYTYLPSIGIACAAAFGLAELVRVRPGARIGAAVASAAVLATLALLSRGQIDVWRSSTALFEHALEVTEDNHLAHANLGWVHLVEGRNEEARAQLSEAVRIHPGDPKPRINLGIAFMRLGRLDESQAILEACLGATPTEWRVHGALGELAFARGDDARAAARLEEAVRLGSTSAATWIQLAKATLNLGRLDRATEAARLAMELAPEDAEPHFVLGVIAGERGASENARAHWSRALELDPDHRPARRALGDG